MNAYPTEIQLDAEWLKQNLTDPQLRVLDVRSVPPHLPKGYRAGHVPNAIALDVGRDFFVFIGRTLTVAAPANIARTLAQCGIANDWVIRTFAIISARWQIGSKTATCQSNKNIRIGG